MPLQCWNRTSSECETNPPALFNIGGAKVASTMPAIHSSYFCLDLGEHCFVSSQNFCLPSRGHKSYNLLCQPTKSPNGGIYPQGKGARLVYLPLWKVCNYSCIYSWDPWLGCEPSDHSLALSHFFSRHHHKHMFSLNQSTCSC